MSETTRHSAYRAGRTIGRFVLPGVCLAVAATMTWLAVPRAVAGLILFGAESSLSSLRLGEAVPAAARKSLLEHQRSALAWSSAGGPLIDYGFSIIAAQVRDANEGKRTSTKETNAEAERALVAGLAKMPVSAEGWFVLAVVRRATPGNEAKAASAVRMSVFTGPHVPVLVVARLRTIFYLWPQFGDDERQLIYRQVRFAWAVAPEEVVEIAVNALNDWPIRIALSLQPKELARFEKMLTAAKKKAGASKAK